MSEAIITRRGYTAEGKPQLMTETITSNIVWTCPNIRSTVSVRIFGGGQGGSDDYPDSYGGCGGWMNNAEIAINNGEQVSVTIGAGGVNGRAGGSTSFGTYLSANGGGSGGCGAGGGGEGALCDANQFGGGAGDYSGSRETTQSTSGRGGIWGGGGGGIAHGTSRQRVWFNGGAGGTYGGGGGGGAGGASGNACVSPGGNGGQYGGGGGGSIAHSSYHERYLTGGFGIGGQYGGNGGNANVVARAENGTNTIGNLEVPEELQGPGIGGMGVSYGGGGGGGGFGGNGGAGGARSLDDHWNSVGGGGGGGYGSSGGRGYGAGTYSRAGGGGGGGYGGNGAPGSGSVGGGGGGYFSDATSAGGGGYMGTVTGYGGGGYGNNPLPDGTPGFGGGGRVGNSTGGIGICILQYYI